jgi:hypothetical protein
MNPAAFINAIREILQSAAEHFPEEEIKMIEDTAEIYIDLCLKERNQKEEEKYQIICNTLMQELNKLKIVIMKEGSDPALILKLLSFVG